MSPSPKGRLAGHEIVVGITGSIAAYKAAELVSQLVQRQAGVSVVLSRAAREFIGPLTFQALTRRRVFSDPFDLDSVLDPTHISLTEGASLVVVAPATANFLAKAAVGIADDMLTSMLLAVTCPVLVAPAMNDRMWNHVTVRQNIRTLKKRGYQFIEPGEGFLACGTYAKGRLASPDEIVARVESLLK